MKTALIDSIADFVLDHWLVVSSVASLAITGAWFYWVTLPNIHECTNHGFSMLFCLTNVN